MIVRHVRRGMVVAGGLALATGDARAQTVTPIGVTPVQQTYGDLIDKTRARTKLTAAEEELLGKLTIGVSDPARYNATIESLSPDAAVAVAQRYRDIFDSLLGMMGAASEAQKAIINAIAYKVDPVRAATDRAVDTLGAPFKGLPLAPARYAPRLSIEGGYFDDELVTLAGGSAGPHRARADGFYLGGRLTVDLDALTRMGVGVTYSRTSSRLLSGRQSARGTFVLGSIYGSAGTLDGTSFDVLVTAGRLSARTRRSVDLFGTPYTLVSESDPAVLGAELGVSRGFFAGDFVMLPRLAVRGSHIAFDPVAETGGLPALRYDRYVANSLTGRAGLTFSGTSNLRPWFSGTYVHEFIDRPDGLGAGFAVSTAPGGEFLLATQDRDWGELSGGLTYGNEGVAISLGAQTLVSRSDLTGATYHGSLALRF